MNCSVRRGATALLVAGLMVGAGVVAAPAAGAVPKPGSSLTLETSSLVGFTDRVDLDPAALDLCQLGLWLETDAPWPPPPWWRQRWRHGNAVVGWQIGRAHV